MTDTLFPVKPEIAAHALVNADTYKAMTARAAADPAGFWSEQKYRINWFKQPTQTLQGDFSGDVRVTWFADGTLNASVSCLDRHLASRGDQVAIILGRRRPEHPEARHLQATARAGLPARQRAEGPGGPQGRPGVHLPADGVEAAVAMLACARIGAVHTVVFGGFSPDSLANRIQDAGVKVLITADEGRRGGRKVALKTNADAALKHCPDVAHVLVVGVTGGSVPMQAGRDLRYETNSPPPRRYARLRR